MSAQVGDHAPTGNPQENNMKARLKAFAESLPERHSYRIHLTQHFDIDAGMIGKIVEDCEFCQVYLQGV